MGFQFNGNNASTLGSISPVIVNDAEITNVVANSSTVWTFHYFYANWSGDWIGGSYPTSSEFGVSTSGSLYRAQIHDSNESSAHYGSWLSVSSNGSLGTATSVATAANGQKFTLKPNISSITWSFYDGGTTYDAVGSCSFDAYGGGFTGSAYFDPDPSQGFFTGSGAIKAVANSTASPYRTLT